MIIKTTEELTDFTRSKLEKSDLSIKEIAEKVGITEKYLDHAISKNQRSNSGRNNLRLQVLSALGLRASSVFLIA